MFRNIYYKVVGDAKTMLSERFIAENVQTNWNELLSHLFITNLS